MAKSRKGISLLCALSLSLWALAAQSATDSATMTPPTTTPNSILILATGIIKKTDSPILNLSVLYPGDNVYCPKDFTPYITLSESTNVGTTATASTWGKTFASGPGGTCLINIQDLVAGKSYKAAVLSVHTNTLIIYDTNTFSIYDPTPQTGTTNIHWVLYCYPPSTPAPYSYYGKNAANFDPTGNCNINTAPYNSNYVSSTYPPIGVFGY